MTPAARAASAAGVVALVLSHTTAASATFTSALARATAGYSSSTLQPASAVSASCTVANAKARAAVSWTASTSPYASGYSISYTGTSTGIVSAPSSPTTININNLTVGGTYTFTVTTTFRSWTSPGRSSLSTTC